MAATENSKGAAIRALRQASQSKLLADPQRYRKGLGQNQSEFWLPLGVTQSGGSRYENTRRIPMATQILMVLRERGMVSDGDLAAAKAVVLATTRKAPRK